MVTEEWRMIPGYEGLYKISNKLRVYDIKNNCFKDADERNGYLHIRLTKGKKRTTYKLSRLFALAFLPYPDELKGIPMDKIDVHHIDGNRLNNDIDNLMWVTHAKHMEIHKSKPVYQYDLNGNLIKEWISFSEVEQQLGFYRQNIRKCCVGKLTTAYGYQWRYKKQTKIEPVKTRCERIGEANGKTVCQYSLDNKLIKVWPSASEIERQLGICGASISRCCRNGKTYKGFIWQYPVLFATA